jgi:hypothetical protein
VDRVFARKLYFLYSPVSPPSLKETKTADEDFLSRQSGPLSVLDIVLTDAGHYIPISQWVCLFDVIVFNWNEVILIIVNQVLNTRRKATPFNFADGVWDILQLQPHFGGSTRLFSEAIAH